MATLPTIPVEPAGKVAASADHQSWASACTFLLGSGAGTNPMFFLMSSATQSFTTTASACIWSNTAAVFKDNDGGWAVGNPTRYTIKTAGYWTFDYNVSAGTTPGNVGTYLQVTTSAANPYNPSTTVKFCYNYSSAASTVNTNNSSGSLCPIYLAVNDYVEVYCVVAVTSTSGTAPFTHFTGELVSS